LKKEDLQLKENSLGLTKKHGDKEKMNKLYTEKLNKLIEERKKFLLDENEKRNLIVKEAEEYVKELQARYEKELPEKQLLIQENQRLRQEIETYINESLNIKETIENKLKIKEQTEQEDSYKNEIKTVMESVSINAQRYVLENIELKKQAPFYKQKLEEMTETINSYKLKYNEFMNELEKVNLSINSLEKRGYYNTCQRKYGFKIFSCGFK
jgi:hypothetical protein